MKELLSATNLKLDNDKILRKNYFDEISSRNGSNKNDNILSEKGKYTSKNLNTIFFQSEETQAEIDNGYEKLSNSYVGREVRMNSKNNLDSNRQSRNNEIFETNALSENNNLNISTISKDKDSAKEEKNNEKIKYNYNLFDKIIGIICKCCLTKKLKIKDDLTEKAISLLDSKLDITLYVRNMMLIDIMNEILFDPETRDIVNLLTRPIISLKNNDEKNLSLFYHKYIT